MENLEEPTIEKSLLADDAVMMRSEFQKLLAEKRASVIRSESEELRDYHQQIGIREY